MDAISVAKNVLMMLLRTLPSLSSPKPNSQRPHDPKEEEEKNNTKQAASRIIALPFQ
jgi:hypothetical protein